MNKTDNNRLSTSNNANSIYNHKSETMSLVNFITKLKNSQIKSDKTSSSIPRKRKRKRKKKTHFLGKQSVSEIREKEVRKIVIPWKEIAALSCEQLQNAFFPQKNGVSSSSIECFSLFPR